MPVRSPVIGPVTNVDGSRSVDVWFWIAVLLENGFRLIARRNLQLGKLPPVDLGNLPVAAYCTGFCEHLKVLPLVIRQRRTLPLGLYQPDSTPARCTILTPSWPIVAAYCRVDSSENGAVSGMQFKLGAFWLDDRVP
jgi:hypothetical protein